MRGIPLSIGTPIVVGPVQVLVVFAVEQKRKTLIAPWGLIFLRAFRQYGFYPAGKFTHLLPRTVDRGCDFVKRHVQPDAVATAGFVR